MTNYRRQPSSSRQGYSAHERKPDGYPTYAQPGGYRPVQPVRGSHGKTACGRSSQMPDYRFDQQGNRSPKKKKGGVARVVFVVALVVLLASLIAVGVIAYSYWQGQNTYNEVAEQVFTPPSDIEGAALEDLTVDWDALRAINPDIVGWIYIPETQINYPVVHTDNNETYLTHDFKGDQGWLAQFGTIFLAAENRGDFTDANNVLYGHNMNDGSMFASIARMTDQATFDASRTIYILTPQGNYRLNTFSLVHCAADDPIVETAFASEEDRVAYVQDKIDRSVVSAAGIPSAAEMGQTYMFSTCDNLASDGRYVLFAYVADSTVANVVSTDTQEGQAAPDAASAVEDATKEITS